MIGLYPLLPDQMEVDRDAQGRLLYTYTTREQKTINLRQEDVLHIAMIEETDRSGSRSAYDADTRQYTIQWTWCLREEVA